MKKNIKPVVEEIDSSDVVEAFEVFLGCYNQFRISNGLKNKIKNVHEILTAMTDKHGRICRYIKHQERNDPKDNWQKEMVSSLTGYIIYMTMLLSYYGIDIKEGVISELNESIKQHKPRKNK